MRQYADLAVYIGRFQPLHLGHLHAIKSGMTKANHVLVLMGDTGGARSIKNPWTYEERRQMLMRSLRQTRELDRENAYLVVRGKALCSPQT